MVPVVKIGEDTIPWTKTSNTFNFLKCIGDWKMFNRTGGITVCMKPFLLSPAVNLTVAEDYCESIGYKITGLATVIEAQWVIAQILKLVPNLAPEWEGFWIDGYRNCPPPLPAGCSNFSYSDGYTVTGDISSKTTLSYNDWT
uniref:C-type lectin domain-containing protein n=1 Tax=Caenorhabditis tropicalis TaxID=1561998 RepID=A0A1I7SZ36_9PELO